MDNNDPKILEVLCVAVEDLPIPQAESEIRSCQGCGEPVWVSKSTLARVEEVLSEHPDVEVHFFCSELIPITLGDLLSSLPSGPPSMN